MNGSSPDAIGATSPQTGIPFSQLLSSRRAGEREVAFGREGRRSEAELREDVAALACRLEPVSGARVLLHCEDAYAFAVGLLAAAQVGACAVLPPSRQPGALRRLAAEVDGALLDGPEAPDTLEGRPCWHPLASPRTTRRLVALDREAKLVELFTSGTTGAGKPVAKAVRHLEDEVLVLEERFGPLVGGDARVLATVSPQHLYGLLFRVVWPLSAGRAFLRGPVLHPEELSPHFSAEAPFALATTPLFLRHCVEKGALAPPPETCRAVFSSGGPLAASVARRAARLFGTAPWEVYGSTETGGVAARQQRRGDEAWQPLPGVAVAPGAAGEVLEVTSPFVSCGEPEAGGRARFELGDRARFEPDGRFHLLGRADRVVKIGEKRLSLPAMEQRLKTHPALADAALVALEQGGDARVGAVAVPSAVGREIAASGGRRALAKALAEHLAPDFDRVLLPRAWRVVDALPRDRQGKASADALAALFADEEPAPRVPARLALRREARRIEARLRIPENLAFLDGHYPAFPVVAGVVQVHFAMHALGDLLGIPPRLASLEALKFRELLLPGDEVRLSVRLAEDALRFDFELADPERPERVFSSGRGRLERRRTAP